MKQIHLNKIVNYEINLLDKTDNYVIMTQELLQKSIDEWKSTLWYQYYKQYQPNNLNDIFHTTIPILQQLPPETIFEPWTHSKPIPLHLFKRKGLYGWKDDDYIYKQIKKTKQLIESIQSKGFLTIKSDRNNIVVDILQYKNEEKFIILGGNHRINVLKALGYQTIQVNLNHNKFLKPKQLINNQRYRKEKPDFAIIRFEDAKDWPAVKSGYLSIKEAQEIFLAYFNCK